MYKFVCLFAILAAASSAPAPAPKPGYHFDHIDAPLIETAPVIATAPYVHAAPIVHAIETPVVAAAPYHAVHAEPIIAAPVVHPAVPIGGYAANYVAPSYAYHGDLGHHYW